MDITWDRLESVLKAEKDAAAEEALKTRVRGRVVYVSNNVISVVRRAFLRGGGRSGLYSPRRPATLGTVISVSGRAVAVSLMLY